MTPDWADDEEAEHLRVPDRWHPGDSGLHRLLSQTQHRAQDQDSHLGGPGPGLPGSEFQK